MSFRAISALGAALLLSTSLVSAQEPKLACKDSNERQGSRLCEMREKTLPSNGSLDVSAAPNGGISIQAWAKNEVLVRAQVTARADSESEARLLLSEVRVVTSPGQVKAEGPKDLLGRQKNWSVTFEIFAPAATALKLDTVNGGIHVSGVSGSVKAETVNGGLKLAGTTGRIHAQTVNGGINVDISAGAWKGDGLDLKTVNGGVELYLPGALNAQVEASTVHGGLNVDYEGAKVVGTFASKKTEFTLGSGGPKVKVETVNGGVRIRRKVA
jgi:hypothetical protein